MVSPSTRVVNRTVPFDRNNSNRLVLLAAGLFGSLGSDPSVTSAPSVNPSPSESVLFGLVECVVTSAPSVNPSPSESVLFGLVP